MITLAFAAAGLVLAASMVRALVVQARLSPPFCARCGEKLERSRMGETICNCRH
jgi:hypothetical protein